MQHKHGREIADKEVEHKQEISFLKAVIAKAAARFPDFCEMLRIENLCALSDSATDRQRSSRESRWNTQGTLFGGTQTEIQDRKGKGQVMKGPSGGLKLIFAIDRKSIAEWFKEHSTS